MRIVAITAISTLSLFVPGNTVDGIAVSTQINVFLWGTNGEMQAGGDIMRYDVSANRVVKTTRLFDGGGGDAAGARSRARFPAINVEGTKVAFYRITNDSGAFVSVMNIDGAGKRDLARIPSQTGYDGTGYLHWVREGPNEWVYYMMGGGNSSKAGNKLMWRVNAANPAQNEQVVAFQYYLWQWGLSSDGAKAFLRLSENQPVGQTFRYLMPGNGSIDTKMSVAFGSGCGVALSPSGLYLIYMQGGTHNFFRVDDWANNDPAVHGINSTSVDINAWAANGSATFTTSCPDWGTIVVGVGMSCNRWSCNSDRWLCLCMGWPDAGSGMFTMCGSNQVLCNWNDKITVMASSNPRMCVDSSARANCDKNLPFVSGRFYQNDAGDFWCATAADVNEDLRAYLTGVARPADAPRAGIEYPFEGTWGKIRTDIAGSVRIELPAGSTCRVRFLDMQGRTALTRTARGSLILAHGSLRAGVYQVRAERPGAAGLRAMMAISR